MKASDSNEKENQETEQTGNENPQEQKPTQQRRVHGPMQLRVFEKMGMRLRVNKHDSSTDQNDYTN
jgi:hypothetical protein